MRTHNKKVFYCKTTKDVHSNVSILRHKITRKFLIEGKLIAKYEPVTDEYGDVVPSEYKPDEKGYVCVGKFRSGINSEMYARNGSQLPVDVNLEIISIVDWETGMNVLHGGSIPKRIAHLLN